MIYFCFCFWAIALFFCCNKVVAQQHVEWRVTQWIGFIATVAIFVSWFSSHTLLWFIFVFGLFHCFSVYQEFVQQHVEWRVTQWIGFIATVDTFVSWFQTIHFCDLFLFLGYFIVYLLHQVVAQQHVEWRGTQWIGFIATVANFVSWFSNHTLLWFIFIFRLFHCFSVATGICTTTCWVAWCPVNWVYCNGWDGCKWIFQPNTVLLWFTFVFVFGLLHCFSVATRWLHNNMLSGVLPSELGSLQQLQYL